jgi:glucose/arabinose dehydrogenase
MGYVVSRGVQAPMVWRILLLAMMVLSASLMLLLFQAKPAAATTLPPGFEDQLVASPNDDPIALAPTPDRRMLVALKNQGKILVIDKDGQMLQTPALDIKSKLCSKTDSGLLGVAVDPNFFTNHYVYIYYTYNKHGVCPLEDPTNPLNPVNRVSRFVMSGNTLDPSTETVLIDNISSVVRHNAGDLNFGKDGYLYATVGDGGQDYAGDSGGGGRNDASRDTHILLGKVLRVTRNGQIPPSNPFTGASSEPCGINGGDGRTDPGKHCQETFAWGLRNPYRFAFDPDASDTRFFIGDVGENFWEEIDEGKAGADYGWNLCEGTHDNPARSGSVNCSADPYTPPVFEYGHVETGCEAAISGAFVPDGFWPASYNDRFLFGDFVCNKILQLTPKAGGGFTMSEFATGVPGPGPIEMTFGPYGSGQAFYYSTLANNGEIHRIVYVGEDANLTPTASVETTGPNYGPTPLTVNFDGSASQDPDGDTPLTYLWNFGDGTAPEETSTPTTSHTYTTTPTDSYTAELRVRDARGAVSAPDTVKIFPGNGQPEPTINSPAATKLFRVGEQITLQGSATDPQDGQLSGTALSWEVRQWHDGNHYHPFASGTGSNLTITTPGPEDGLRTTGPGNYLEIVFTATDSKGLSKTITQELQPNRVNVTLDTNPGGLSLEANSEAFAAPRTILSWEGYKLNVNAPSPQNLSGTTYVFDSWSDGQGQNHDIVTGTTPSTYTATFKASSLACTITGTSANDTLTGTSGADVICGGGGNDTIKGLGGNDILKGEGGGADKLFGGEGNDSLDGGIGTNDSASYADSTVAIIASLTGGSATGEGSDTLIGVESLTGSSKNDSLTGSVVVNTLSGGSGNDTLSGLDGADKLNGGGNADTIQGGSGNDSVVGNGGPDNLLGEGGDDALNSKDNVNGNDSLDGGTHVNGDTCTTDTTEKSIVNCEL